MWPTDVNTKLEGTGEFIKLMKEHGKKIHFLSNNSMRSKEEYKEHFDKVGIPDGFVSIRHNNYAGSKLYLHNSHPFQFAKPFQLWHGIGLAIRSHFWGHRLESSPAYLYTSHCWARAFSQYERKPSIPVWEEDRLEYLVPILPMEIFEV